jgi:hypothetical protein
MAADQCHAITRALQRFGQEPDQCFVGGGVDRRSRYFYTQLIPERFTYCIGRSSGLELYRKQHAIGLDAEEGRYHEDKCSLKFKSPFTISIERPMGNPNAFAGCASFHQWLCCVGLACLAGCTTKPTQPAAASLSAAAPPTVSSVAPAPSTAPSQEDNSLKKFAAIAPAPFEGDGWQPLFDGSTLTGWHETKFSGRGEVEVRDGLILAKMGDPFTGINLTNDFPKMDYEIALDAMRVNGADFFCGLTLPIGNAFCSLIVGGWGGGLVGISSLDGMDASENETTKYVTFQQGHWYRIRLRVTQGRLEGWIDGEKLIDVVTTGKKISLRPGEIEESKPFGLACWQTSAAWREIKFRHEDHAADKPKKY